MFVRNPHQFDVKHSKEAIHNRNKVNADEVNKYINHIKDIVKFNEDLTEEELKILGEKVEMVKYLCQHPNRTNFNTDRKLNRTIKLIEDIKEIDHTELKDLISYDIVPK